MTRDELALKLYIALWSNPDPKTALFQLSGCSYSGGGLFIECVRAATDILQQLEEGQSQ
jgi:hypothetical protein